jgi:hypothetical protein
MAAMARRQPAARLGGLCLLAAALTALALPVQAQKGRAKEKAPAAPPPAAPPLRVDPFLGDFDSARRLALDRNAPLVFIAMLEGEETSDRVRDEIYKNADFARACAGAVVVLLNDGKHEEKKLQVEGADGSITERTVCSVYETPTCKDHSRAMNRFFQEFHDGGDKEAMKMPHFLVLLPGGKIQGRLSDEIQKGAALKLIADAQAIAGPSITAEQLVAVQSELSTMRHKEGSLAWADAWRASERVLAIAAAGANAEAARAGAGRALAALRAELKAAQDLLAAGKVEDGYARLRGLAQELQDTPLAAESAEAQRQAERDKRWKDEIAGIKRREEADGLWKQCQAALAEDKLPLAERLAERILKRYAGTPAAARAAERFPELAKAQGSG